MAQKAPRGLAGMDLGFVDLAVQLSDLPRSQMSRIAEMIRFVMSQLL